MGPLRVIGLRATSFCVRDYIGIGLVLREWEIPWSMTMELNTIKRLRALMSVRVQHSLKKRNTLVDFLLI
ncbi:hypothetical protein H5410_022352 [Solanum commersonii]|uniref:Uncharacterized protein n=1 Tax=Solanum commersonii TaxID=4109 RepID=A0A9J5ZGI5_SOLCO|nr:hypothetical protein H5410_022352 [Solanum commersonii]